MAGKKNWRIVVRRYINLLRKEMTLDRIIVFGSYIRGTPRRHSDIDVAVFSPRFAKGDEIKHMQYLLRQAYKVDTHLEPHPYAPADLKKVQAGTLLAEIVRTGKVIR